MTRQNAELLFLVIVLGAVAFLASGCGQTDPTAFTKAPYLSCTTENVPGGAVIACPDGSGALIANGAVGGAGPTGPQGVQGQPGTPGTKVVPIQLCPNVKPTYASVFPEFALCINGALYGTFNNNTSYQYLSELPNGVYSSNGQGAACSMTITGCLITY